MFILKVLLKSFKHLHLLYTQLIIYTTFIVLNVYYSFHNFCIEDYKSFETKSSFSLQITN